MGDQLSVLEIEQTFGGFGLPRLTVGADEEAVASWFLAAVAREEELRGTLPAPRGDSPAVLTDADRARLVRTISELLRFRLSPPDGPVFQSGEAGGAPARRSVELSQHLRWPSWWVGSDFEGNLVLNAILFTTVAAVLLWLLWLALLLPLELNERFPSDAFEKLDAAARFTEYLLPALGFLGTIAGLGRAFGTVGIISEILTLQKLALMSVLLNLGTAFSTTFFALAAGVLVTLSFSLLRAFTPEPPVPTTVVPET